MTESQTPLPPAGPAELAITFLYCRDMPRASEFYARVLALPLAIDQGWCRIHRIAGAAHVGLVDETRGMHRWRAEKTAQLCLRVGDVSAWHARVAAAGVEGLTTVTENTALGIRAFTFRDPEGHPVEIQTPTRPGA